MDRAIESASLHPKQEATVTVDPSTLHPEGLAVCVELTYNGEIGKSQFILYVMEELRRRLLRHLVRIHLLHPSTDS